MIDLMSISELQSEAVSIRVFSNPLDGSSTEVTGPSSFQMK
jgi:hypothetical protein